MIWKRNRCVMAFVVAAFCMSMVLADFPERELFANEMDSEKEESEYVPNDEVVANSENDEDENREQSFEIEGADGDVLVVGSDEEEGESTADFEEQDLLHEEEAAAGLFDDESMKIVEEDDLDNSDAREDGGAVEEENIEYSDVLEDGNPASGTCGENATWSFAGGTLTIDGYGAMYDYENGSQPWKDKSYYITEIVVNEGITTIGDYAFSGLSKAEYLSLPNGLKTVGKYAFYHSVKLSDILLPDGLVEIGEHAFAYCEGLQEIIVPASTYSLGEWAFYNCEKLKIVDFASGGNISVIPSRTFYGCYSLAEITLPEKLSEIGDRVFYHCISLESINLPSTISKIGGWAFDGCEKLTQIVIPSSLTTIEIGTFQNCSALKAVTIPVSVTNITGFAFAKCITLSDVYYMGSKINWQNIFIGSNESSYLTSATIHYLNTEKPILIKKEQSFTVHYDKCICMGRTSGVQSSGAKTKLTYMSSNTSVAAISVTGVITPKKIGKTSITVAANETEDYYGAECVIEISVVPTTTKALKTSNEPSGIKLSWEIVPGATGYYVYRDDTKIAQLKSGKATSFVDKKAASYKTYTYKLSAYASSGESTLCKKSVICRMPSTTITSISQKSQTVKVVWKKQKQSNGYELHYSLDFKKGYNTKRIASPKQAYATINKLTRKKKYSFRVRSYKKVKNITYYSAWSAVKSKKLN